MNIPGYKIESLIAEGGMAAVYLAVQESLGRKVALKILKKFDTPEQSERFINEGKIIASLNHHNIITIHDIGTFEDKHYLSMEYLEGGDLESKIDQGVSPEFALDIIKTIGHCLEFIHERGIVHRDIKPANILFRKDNTPVLTDFGIAKQLQVDAKLTMDGTAMGSPSYLSPEQARSEKLDGRTDIYSLGVVLFQMLTGYKPYYGNSFIDTVMEHISAPIPTLPSDLSRYQKLLEKMMAKRPEDRFLSASEMVSFIDSLERPAFVEGVSDKITKLVTNIRSTSDVDKNENVTSNDNDATQKLDSRNLQSESARAIRKLLLKNYSVQIIGITVILMISGIWLLSSSDPPVLTIDQVETKNESEKTISIKNKTKIEKYLAKADEALKADRLTVPEEDNAYSYYQKVLRIEPANKAALVGVSKIAERYADLAEWQLTKYNYSKAERYVYKGLDIQPDNERLLKLEKRVSSAVKDVSERVVNKLKSVF